LALAGRIADGSDPECATAARQTASARGMFELHDGAARAKSHCLCAGSGWPKSRFCPKGVGARLPAIWRAAAANTSNAVCLTQPGCPVWLPVPGRSRASALLRPAGRTKSRTRRTRAWVTHPYPAGTAIATSLIKSSLNTRLAALAGQRGPPAVRGIGLTRLASTLWSRGNP